jgi:REP element-mobilizing transposase RayT
MKFDPQRHRKSTRMKGYDYSLAGAYFVTLVTYQREMLFGEIIHEEMHPSRRGEIVREEWFRSAQIRREIRLYPEEFVVMPNHIHGIVWIVETDDTTANENVGANGIIVGAHGRAPLQRKPKSLSSFVAGYKSSVIKQIRDELNETGIWQRNYYDRIIRDDRELDGIRKYIETNPMHWEKDDENPIKR